MKENKKEFFKELYAFTVWFNSKMDVSYVSSDCFLKLNFIRLLRTNIIYRSDNIDSSYIFKNEEDAKECYTRLKTILMQKEFLKIDEMFEVKK